MSKNDIIKKSMTKDLVDYLIEEKIIDKKHYLIKINHLTSYENIKNIGDITLHMLITVNDIEYLVEKIIKNHTLSELNIYRVDDVEETNNVEFVILKTIKEKRKKE